MKKEVTLVEIEASARTFSEKRTVVKELATDLQDKIAALQRQFMPRIRRAVEAATEAELDLRGLVEAAPGLFVKPKTVIFHGIKVGFVKGKGGITWDDADKVCGLIHRHYTGAAAEALLHITEKPDKEALAKLSVAELKKIGCEVTETEDAVVVKSTDSEIDKVVTALLKSAVEEAINQEAA